MLRSPERGDWQEWTRLRGDSRAFLAPWEPSWSSDAMTRAAFRRRLARYAADWRTDQGYSFFVCRMDSGALVGGIGLSNVRRGVAETGSLGYWVGERYARQGYMTEGLRLMLVFAFERLKLHRVEAKKGGVAWELYNLENDERETTNLLAKEPERSAEMQKQLKTWLKSVVGSLNGKDY